MTDLVLGRDADLTLTPTTAIAAGVSRSPSPSKNVRIFIGNVDLAKVWTGCGVAGAAVIATSLYDDEIGADAASAGWGGTVNGQLVDAFDPWQLATEETIMIVDVDAGWAIAVDAGVTAAPTTARGDGHQGFTLGWTQQGDAVVAAPKTGGSAAVPSDGAGWYWDSSAETVKPIAPGDSQALANGDIAVVGARYGANNTAATGTAVSLGSGTVADLGWTNSASATVIPGGRGVRRSAIAPQRARTLTAAVEGSAFAAAALAYLNGRRTSTRFVRRTAAGQPRWDVQAIAQPSWSANRQTNRTGWQLTLTADGDPVRSNQTAAEIRAAAKAVKA